jgi:phosphoribosylformylglycinamidine synthase II
MIWEIEIHSKGLDREKARIAADVAMLTHEQRDTGLRQSSRGYLVEGELAQDHVDRLLAELLVDPLVETGGSQLLPSPASSSGDLVWTVLPKPGVMDPAALSVMDAARDIGIPLDSVRTFRRYYFANGPAHEKVLARVIANDAIDLIVTGPLRLEHLAIGRPYRFSRCQIPIRELSDEELTGLSRSAQLYLSVAEMQTIQAHYRELGREPTDVELETLAQTWSEHCSHKTLKGPVEIDGRRIGNLLRETIFAATDEIRRRLGGADWCVSVFEDNAGVVRFNDRYHICFKVETHNHPSAIEPYGGANTGIGGVIRDPLGTGLGALPIANTDIFCFASPDYEPEKLPPGVLHPRKVMQGVVAGVRDYGNRMGIPTINGAICFDDRYVGNPLVFCGTVGLIPIDRTVKRAEAGDLIVVVGGRTGRDGIHGATFSSVELTEGSDTASGGAVQIGNAITEKKLLDVIIQARDQALYHAITDCGAGGFSSAIGEMGEKLGARVELDRAPLKYQGLSYTEIWISESQERMILAVPEESWPALEALCKGEDVEATRLGTFDSSGRLRLYYQGHEVADLAMSFLHGGRPAIVRRAELPVEPRSFETPKAPAGGCTEVLTRILASYSVCSKEWVIRQYDHEVQGGLMIKPLVGERCDGPGDAAIITPVLGSTTGIALGCGLNPRYGDLDPYRMAAAAVDEAVRNVVAVGADPGRIALLDNFCWGNTDRPEQLGTLVRAAEACRDTALAYGTPFVSGKDSLNNEYHFDGQHITIPPTLLISALGRVADVRHAVTMDLKGIGNLLYLVGATREEMGGSHFNLVTGQTAGQAPAPDLECAPAIFRAVATAIERGLIRSCHDLSEGGLAVAIAEMAFAGVIGADITVLPANLPDHIALFSESTTRFALEVTPEHAGDLESLFQGLPLLKLGQTCPEKRLRIAGADGQWIVWATLDDLREAWQKPLRW